MKRIYFFILLFFSVETSVFSAGNDFSVNLVSGGKQERSDAKSLAGNISVLSGVPFSLELMGAHGRIMDIYYDIKTSDPNSVKKLYNKNNTLFFMAKNPGEQILNLICKQRDCFESFKIHVLEESAVTALQVKDIIFKNDRECVPLVVQANFANSSVTIPNPELFDIDNQAFFLKEDDNNLSLCVKSSSPGLEVAPVTLSLKNSPNTQAKFNVAFLQGAEIKLSYEGEIKDNNYTGVNFSLNFLNFPSWGVCRDIKEVGMQTNLPGENEIPPGTTTLPTKFIRDLSSKAFFSFACRLDFGETQGDYVMMSFQPPKPSSLSKEDFEQLTKGLTAALQVSFEETAWTRRTSEPLEDLGHTMDVLNPIWHMFLNSDRYYSFSNGSIRVTTSQQALNVLEKNHLTFDPAKSIQLVCGRNGQIMPIDFTGASQAVSTYRNLSEEKGGYFNYFKSNDQGYQIQLRNLKTTFRTATTNTNGPSFKAVASNMRGNNICNITRSYNDRNGKSPYDYSDSRVATLMGSVLDLPKAPPMHATSPSTFWTDFFLINTLVDSTTGISYNFVAKFHALIGVYSLSGANYSASPVPLTQDDIAYLESNNIRVDYLIGSN